MQPISFKRHRFPPSLILHAVWLHARFTLSFRDVEELKLLEFPVNSLQNRPECGRRVRSRMQAAPLFLRKYELVGLGSQAI
jgi:hypothetical protein